jgi:uncharacterized protein (TIGR03067 family)
MTPVLLTLALAVAAPTTKDAKKDAPSIVGEWLAESAIESGKPDPPPPGTTWTFMADGKSIITIGGAKGRDESSYTTDPKIDPPWLDVAASKGAAAMKGIYKVEGDTLTLCLIDGPGDRPTKFESPAGSVFAVFTLMRVKKE